jgi:response regulator of citrate/malate metabolism
MAKRELTGAARRRDLLLLVTDLQKLQSKYPRLRNEIQSDIDDHLRQAERTRESDRRAVVDALQRWREARLEGADVDELSDETGLSEATVRRILNELLDEGRIEFFEKETERDRGRPTRYYFLTEIKSVASV